MKKDTEAPYKFESLSEFHRVLGLPKPVHPLISLVYNTDGKIRIPHSSCKQFILPFYKISYKPNLKGKFRYGQHYYDFEEGGLFFLAPNQLTGTSDENLDFSGFTLFVHPDLLLNYPLAKKIKQYNFFSYAATEVLHLSDQEKEVVLNMARLIDDELNSRIDRLSQDVLISQLELFLNYAYRFYQRQFLTRKAVNNDLLQKMEDLLDVYFDKKNSANRGLPTVQYLADQLHLSPHYLSDMLRSLTGLNAQQHIHLKLIDKAKELLSTTNLSISQVAYELSFEHPQSFSTLFKTKTSLSPQEFRKSFN
ncbi:helix-turn-helix domain-containing protein [Mucilaginibacter ginsenosidivorax]|uniref:Helix-turn-helix domain-containing protein n=1 Tax=Mucilaginibacter ginsenosidivorax TaxID=862126 RepID=A0A5B8W6Q2_9SPHI|nr:AraC family transcriptional regulator [Mucilaginibacter ginsenosidivorax]QEC78606.1 helix-turn-helix domain-containing protein [Mucilaginibacter ginsenosidivorax]